MPKLSWGLMDFRPAERRSAFSRMGELRLSLGMYAPLNGLPFQGGTPASGLNLRFMREWDCAFGRG